MYLFENTALPWYYLNLHTKFCPVTCYWYLIKHFWNYLCSNGKNYLITVSFNISAQVSFNPLVSLISRHHSTCPGFSNTNEYPRPGLPYIICILSRRACTIFSAKPIWILRAKVEIDILIWNVSISMHHDFKLYQTKKNRIGENIVIYKPF